jgi:hypothetical protein
MSLKLNTWAQNSDIVKLKNIISLAWWLMPVIFATWEVEIGSLGKKVCKTSCQPIKAGCDSVHGKCTWEV